MIVAGDAIDASLGVRFGVSTLAAAGLGNLISDVCGVGMGDLIEVGALRMGLAVPAMTAAEAGMRATAITKTSASVIGNYSARGLAGRWTKSMCGNSEGGE